MSLFKRFFAESKITAAEKKSSNNKGNDAENLALDFLLQRSFTLRQRNYRCKLGEIDLIVESPQGTVVFVEVRFRKKSDHGSPLESVTSSKQKKIVRTAQHYLQKHNLSERVSCRFDVIAIEAGAVLKVDSMDNTHINWIENAFTE